TAAAQLPAVAALRRAGFNPCPSRSRPPSPSCSRHGPGISGRRALLQEVSLNMHDAFINRIATATPPHDVHEAFLRFGQSMLKSDLRRMALFGRMAERSGISHRYSFIEPDRGGAITDVESFYSPGNFPDTAARMKKFEDWAPALAVEAVEKLLEGEDRSRITHIIVTSCTGFSAPGIDLAVVKRCNLPTSAERTMVGF